MMSSQRQLNIRVILIAILPATLSFGIMASMLNDPDETVQSAARDQLEFVSEVTFKSKDALAWFNQHKDELEDFEMK